MDKFQRHVCSICKEEYLGFGNNAAPVNEGRCCDDCNARVVIPKRMQYLRIVRDVTKGT